MEASKLSWTKLDATSGIIPDGRSSHSVSVIESKVYIYGGEDTPRHVFDGQVHVFDLTERSWNAHSGSGELPSLRLGQTAVAVQNKLWIIGGRNSNKEDMNDVYTFDINDFTWTKINTTGDVLPICSYHTGTRIGNSVFVFGGCSGSAGRLNAVWKLDTDKHSWTHITTRSTAEETPIARGGPGFVALGDNLYVYGGYSGKQELDDLWRFDVETATWNRILPKGIIPPARSVHCTTTLGNGIVTFGGESTPSTSGHEGAGKYLDDTWHYDPQANEWQEFHPLGPSPTPRGWMAASSLSSNNGIILFGGFGGEARLNDGLYCLSYNH